ncbi:MAG: hypothetical protein HKP58_08495 [Desulfatitalea sp.]|nr:hypothetical protein [Desulfatitalea sp.]NNK00439.1 hypothetical protein [Desulfatitalea sp.]
MRITDLDKRLDGDRIKVRATVRWEECSRPDDEIFIATEARFARDIEPNPHAFVVGALVPALHFGERRIHMEAPVCPRLRQGLQTVMDLFAHWSKGRMSPLILELDAQTQAAHPNRHARAGLFLSGGIDSLATLRCNRRRIPLTHPDAVRDLLIVHGFDIGGVIKSGAKYDVFDRAKAHMAAVAEDAGATLIPVHTNIRHLCDQRDLWLTYFFGAVLAAVGHAFTPRLHLVHIAASYPLAHLAPCGSHPLLDPLLGSTDLQIHHCGTELSRMDKLRTVADWPAAFHNLRVCLANVPDRLNCGRCEKCVRTMTGLAALGRLAETRAFVESDVTPDMFTPFKMTIRHREPFYREMLAPLKAAGRHDLAAMIEEKLSTERKGAGKK